MVAGMTAVTRLARAEAAAGVVGAAEATSSTSYGPYHMAPLFSFSLQRRKPTARLLSNLRKISPYHALLSVVSIIIS